MTPIVHALRVAERVEVYGAEVESTAELLALALGCSTAKAENLLAEARGMLRRLTATEADLSKSQRTRLTAILELMRRATGAEAPREPLRSPKDVYAHYRALETLEVEEFHVAVLDAQHQLKRDIMVTRGILNTSFVHPREVFADAIRHRAAAVILVHNHPSGDPTPSADDRAITSQLVAAGRLLDIPVCDHVIIGSGRYLSFAEGGLL